MNIKKIIVSSIESKLDVCTKEELSHDFWQEHLIQSNSMPFLRKPCKDCAVTCGLYIEIADDLLKQPINIQDAALERWFCHNHTNRACRGAYNYVHSKRKGARTNDNE